MQPVMFRLFALALLVLGLTLGACGKKEEAPAGSATMTDETVVDTDTGEVVEEETETVEDY